MAKPRNRKKQSPSSQPVRQPYFSMITAQVIFEIEGQGIQMITRSTFGTSDSPKYHAAYIHQLQTTLGAQVKQEIEASGRVFKGVIDVVVLALIPLGQMTHEEFWHDMLKNPANNLAEAPLPDDMPTAEQVAAAVLAKTGNYPNASDNIVPFPSSND